jgi:hypothetical protein
VLKNGKDKDFCMKLFSLSSSPTVEELKKKYRELMKLYHPDTHPESIEQSTRMVQQLNEAYELLLPHLHRIYSGSPGFEDLPKKRNGVDTDKIIFMGDNALRDAVITGWLLRTPKGTYAREIRHTIEKAFMMLESVYPDSPGDRRSAFYMDLFSAFLRATVRKKPGTLPAVYNKTKFFQHCAAANRYLDAGMRNYYRLTENGKKLILINIPLSFLEDGIRLFSLLKKSIGDTILKDTINAKIDLAELFRLRIREEGFLSP